MTLVDRHIAFVEALREAGLPVSLAEGLDAVAAIGALGLGERETLRTAYAATLVKRQTHRPGFDQVFDLYWPALVGEGASSRTASRRALTAPATTGGEEVAQQPSRNQADLGADGPQALADFREALATALAMGDPDALAMLAREAVSRFGLIRGRGPGEQRWSSYNVMNRVSPDELVGKALAGLVGADRGDETQRCGGWSRRRCGRSRGWWRGRYAAARPRSAAPSTSPGTRSGPTIEQVEFTSARKADLELMRREIQPLARRLATRVSREQHSRRGRPLDFRRTVRASMSSGGVPLETHHKPRRPGRTDLVVLCDVSGSVANFAGFTLMLVYALREQFNRVRAFTFVDEIHEVSDRFTPGADPARTMSDLAASARYASLWGRTNYGRAFTRFSQEYADALTPKTNLLVLGDARSNHTDLALPVVRDLVHAARHSWWLNPEHHRNWNTGDSAAREYGRLVPMVECRNLTQLGEFVHDLA